MSDPVGNPITQDGNDPPRLSYWHVWADDDGVTHQTKCALSDFAKQSVGGDAAAEWIGKLLTAKANLVFYVQPVGWIGDWHPNPKPQWIVTLSGRWFVETMDGTRVEMGPGEVSFGGDQTTRKDSQGRFGHRSGTVGDELLSLMAFELEGDAWLNVRPGHFK
jgi:hypothetical protein